MVLQNLGDDCFCGQRIVEVRTISHRSGFSRLIERDPPNSFGIESTHLESFDR